MSAAVFAQGTTTIEAAACEPEVVDLGNYLNSAGAKITGLGTPFLQIEGVDKLCGVEHTIIPDRIEAATLMSVTLSCDHRAVDGALGAELIGAFKLLIENPVMMVV